MLIQVADQLDRAIVRQHGTAEQWLERAKRRLARRELERALSPSVRAYRSVRMANDIFYMDTLPPWLVADISAVTLATTAKALYPASSFPILGSGFFKYAGKALLIRMFGRITTAATPGNGSWDIYWGTGADANGTIIVSSAAEALTASQTNISWYMEALIRCRSTGTTGTCFGTGYAIFGEAVKAVRQMIPASAPAVSGSLDLNAANIVSVQFKRSGNTAETMQVHELLVSPVN